MDASTQAARIEAAAGLLEGGARSLGGCAARASWRASRPRVPGYLTKALGLRPERGWGHERWRQGAAAIEGYRERHGITDAQRALGPEPEEGLAPGARRSVERTMEEARASQPGLRSEHGLERPRRPAALATQRASGGHWSSSSVR